MPGDSRSEVNIRDLEIMEGIQQLNAAQRESLPGCKIVGAVAGTAVALLANFFGYKFLVFKKRS